MPEDNSSKLLDVGETLEHHAEAITLSSDPAKRAAAAEWLKKIRRTMARMRKEGSAGDGEQQAA